jgi:hypothetical protein
MRIVSTATGASGAGESQVPATAFGDVLGSEQLTNTTFDANVTNYTTYSSANQTAISRNTNANRIRTGAGSALAVIDKRSPGAFGITYTGTINNTTTDTYLAEAWVYVPTTDSSASVSITIDNQLFSALGTTTTTVTKGVYTKIIIVLTLPGTQTKIGISVRMNNAGLNDTLYVDDVSLKQITTPVLTVGNKYTVEGWARAVGANGTDVVSGWNFTSGWTASSGANILSADSFATTGANKYVYRDLLTTVGRAYRIRLSASIKGSASLRLDNGDISSPYYINRTGTFDTTLVVVADGTILALILSAADTVKISAFQVNLITKPTLTAVLGSKTSTTDTLSVLSGSFEKFVLNFQATASEIGQPLKLYSNQADTIYVDDVSIRQSYDLIVLSKFKNVNNTTAAGLVSTKSTSGSTAQGFHLYAGETGNDKIQIADGTNVATATIASSQNQFVFRAATANRSGNLTMYSGVTSGSAVSLTSVGICNAAGLIIGALAYTTATNFLTGLEGELQVIKFTALPADGGIAIVTDAANRFTQKKNFINGYSGGTVVAWYDWRSGGRDLSGSGNHLTPTASPPIVRIP